MLKTQNFGVEIELTGITRRVAANVIARFFGTTAGAITRTSYKVTDNQGRTWSIVRDSSITPSLRGNTYQVEIVSPILTYNDIETIQELLRKLREKGAKTNSSCGIHIHVDGANHNATSIKNIIHFMTARQDLVYEALGVIANRQSFCKKLDKELFAQIRKVKELDIQKMQELWYSEANDGFNGGQGGRYNSTRYNGINIHSYFYRGTVEFRLFNSTTHAGQLKAYIQFCLAVSAWAISEPKRVSFRGTDDYTANQKATLMNSVLTNRLGLVGAEFKTARTHLTKNLTAQSETVGTVGTVGTPETLETAA